MNDGSGRGIMTRATAQMSMINFLGMIPAYDMA